MRAITFPKTDEGVWTNSETGVRIVRRHVTTGGGFNIYRPTIDTARGEILLDRRPTLAEARAVAKDGVLDLRNEATAAYADAVDEHVERAAAHLGETGIGVGRINMARRAVIYARSDGSGAWLASAIFDVRRIEEAREAALIEAAPTDAGEPIACGSTGRVRTITFARTADGVWTNRETGVRIFRTQRGNYLIERPFLGATVDGVMWRQGNGGWLLVSNDACGSLKQAREIAGREAEKMRDRIAAAYTQACLEDSDREGDRLMAAREAANRTAGNMTYPSDAKAYDGKGGVIEPTVHFDPSFGEPIACGITGRVRITSRRMDVTCDGCKSALDARDFDRTRADLIADHGQAAHDHPDMPRAARLRGTREGVEMLHEISADLDVAERRCTKADGWLQSHPFEYNPNAVEAAKAGNGGYDEYERCGERRDHARHQMPSAAAEPGPDEPISYWPADMLREGDMVAAPNSSTGHTVTETYGSVRPWVALTDTNDRGTAIPASDVVSQWTRVESPGDYMWAADVIHSAKRPEGPGHPRGCTCGECEVRRNGVWRAYGPTGERPAAPDDVNDDEAWAAYCAMLPSPTDEQVAAVAAEYTSPYAEQVQQCVDAFRSTARLLWSLRREGQLTNDRCSTLRHSMRVLRDCIETYRGLAAGARNGVQR